MTSIASVEQTTPAEIAAASASRAVSILGPLAAALAMDEAYGAREAFITSASQIVLPVVRIDGRPVGNGAPGLLASALRRDFHRYAETT